MFEGLANFTLTDRVLALLIVAIPFAAIGLCVYFGRRPERISITRGRR